MPIYAFTNESGDLVERFFSMEEVPSIGDRVTEEDGTVLTRVPDCHIDSAGIERKVWKYPYASHVLPRNLPGCKCDGRGHPIVRSQKHEKEICARHDYYRP